MTLCESFIVIPGRLSHFAILSSHFRTSVVAAAGVHLRAKKNIESLAVPLLNGLYMSLHSLGRFGFEVGRICAIQCEDMQLRYVNLFKKNACPLKIGKVL